MSVLQELVTNGLQKVQEAPSIVCLLAVALLPLIGMPASPLLAALGIRFGLLWGCVAAVPALALNFSLGYWLARRWLRAPLARWLQRRGYRIPNVPPDLETGFILLFRVTPGMPLVAQNYALGLAEVSFRRYLSLSLPVQSVYAFALVWLGDSVADSRVWHGLMACGLLAAAGLATALVRRLLQRRRRRLPGDASLPATAAASTSRR